MASGEQAKLVVHDWNEPIQVGAISVGARWVALSPLELAWHGNHRISSYLSGKSLF
jgi:hypothetical protein